MEKPREPSIARTNDQGVLELRHFSTFQQVYLEKDYTAAAHMLGMDRKGVLRLIQKIESAFGNPLFTEPIRGSLVPTTFSDRLFNDLRFLNAARESLWTRIAEIRDHGRPLKVGGSGVIFRTEVFRSIFRELQTSRSLRVSYVAIPSGDAHKALSSGACDLHIGCGLSPTGRAQAEEIGKLAFRLIERAGTSGGTFPSETWLAASCEGDIAAWQPRLGPCRPLDDDLFLDWLENPAKCPPDTRILTPDFPINEADWTIIRNVPPFHRKVQILRLRHHPYEFLPGLVKNVRLRVFSNDA